MLFLATEIIFRSGDRISFDNDTLNELLGIEIDDDTIDDDLLIMAKETAGERQEYALLVCAYTLFNDKNRSYWGPTWDSEQRRTIFVHKPSGSLDRLYDFLVSLGYQMSDEEKAMQNGTHELFHALDQKEADDGTTD